MQRLMDMPPAVLSAIPAGFPTCVLLIRHRPFHLACTATQSRHSQASTCSVEGGVNLEQGNMLPACHAAMQ